MKPPTYKKVKLVKDELEKKKINADVIVKKIREGLNAIKSVVVDGEVIDVPDFTTRYRYVELLLKVRGELREEVVRSGNISQQVIVIRAKEDEGKGEVIEVIGREVGKGEDKVKRISG